MADIEGPNSCARAHVLEHAVDVEMPWFVFAGVPTVLPALPSCMQSNVRSLNNKTDELFHLLCRPTI